MVYKLNGEQPFQVLSSDFSISPSESGYELYFSADGFNYTSFATVGAGVTRQFTGMNAGNYYKLMGNTGEVSVNWERDCCGGQGGGGGVAGVSSLNGQTGALTTKTINGNDILGSGDITIEGGSEISLEYNQIREIEHKDYVSYTFTHSGSTWGNYEAWVAQITNGENSFQYGIWQGNAGDMKTTFYASGYSNGINPQGLDFLRPIMLEAGFYEKFPEFYIKWNQEGSTDNLTWTFAVPSSYTVEILSLENYPGIEYVGSAIISFTEIAPASPIYLYEGYSANTFSAAVQRYIVRHRFEEEFSIYGDTYWVQREQNGDPGWIAASDLGIGDDKTNAYLSFYGRNGKYLINWIHDGTFLVFGKQSIFTIYNQNFESDLVYNSATDEFTSNGETLSADTAYNYFVNWGGLAEAHKGTVLADSAFMLNYKLPIVSGSTRWEVSHPSVMFEDVSVTIGETQFQKLITFDYGEWIMKFYINGNNETANFKMYHRKDTVSISQSDYDALVQAGTVDANTLYVII